jgi:hypothetical protein
LEAYVEEMANRRIQAGANPEAAREEALNELGGLERIKALVRQQRIEAKSFQLLAVVIPVGLVMFVVGATFGSSIGLRSQLQSSTRVSPAASEKGVSAERPQVIMKGRLVDKTTGQPIPQRKDQP